MSSFSGVDSDWNFRIFDDRLIVVKTKNAEVRKVAAFDVSTGLTFAIEVPEEISLEDLTINKQYMANLKVFTAKDSSGVDKEFINFLAAIDVDQRMEDFIKAYWVYPSKIRFELIEVEEP